MPSSGEIWYTLTTDGTDAATFDQSMTSEPQRRRGRCLDSVCSTWGVGYDQPGHYEVEATICGHQVSMTFDVEAEGDGCHADTLTLPLQADPRWCDELPMGSETGPTCDMMARPSVHVMVAKAYDDYLTSVPVERVWFQYRDRTEDALCVLDRELKCQS